MTRLMALVRERPARRRSSRPASSSRCAAFWPARSSCFAASAIRRAAAPGAVYRISDLELASRLSFFLWSSIPDDELLQVAGQGRLKDPAVLDRQVRRMLADPKSQALVDQLRRAVAVPAQPEEHPPDQNEFPDFDDNLRQALSARDRAVLRKHHARGSQRRRSADAPTTRSSTNGWRATTGCRASTAASSAASRSPTTRERGCSARAASCW